MSTFSKLKYTTTRQQEGQTLQYNGKIEKQEIFMIKTAEECFKMKRTLPACGYIGFLNKNNKKIINSCES